MLHRLALYFSLLALLAGCSSSPAPGSKAASSDSAITHGPMLGRPGAHQMGVWARTAKAGSFLVRYGASADAMTSVSDPVETAAERDNTGWTLLTGLDADTEYFYEVVAETSEKAPAVHKGSFRTWPDKADFVDADVNHDGVLSFDEFKQWYSMPGDSAPVAPAAVTGW